MILGVMMPCCIKEVEADNGANYLTFTSEQDGSWVQFNYWGFKDYTVDTIKYSTDNGATWHSNGQSVDSNKIISGKQITLNKGESVCYKGNATNAYLTHALSDAHFAMSGKISASGDVTSLINERGGNAPLTENIFYGMFKNCTALVSPPNLPSTTLAPSCYANMFQGCTNLLAIPDLPATEMSSLCYTAMFYNCSGLEIYDSAKDSYTKEWKINFANEVLSDYGDSCFAGMFEGIGSFPESGYKPVKNKVYYIYNPHTHNFAYKADGNTIKTYCTETNGASNCQYQGSDTNLTKAITLTLTANGGVYSGSAYQATTNDSTVKFSSTTGQTISIKYVGQEGTNYSETTTAPKSAGKYTAKVTIGSATATKDFEITRAPLTNLSVSLNGWTYGGSTNSPSVSNNSGNGTVTYTYKVKGADDSTYSSTMPTDAGEYTVKASVVQTDNYQEKDVTKDFAIAPKQVKLSGVKVSNKTYDGNTTATVDTTNTPTFTGRLAVDDDSALNYQITSAAFADKNAGEGKTVNLTVELTGTNKANYTFASDTQKTTTANITQKNITTTITPNGGKYKGEITAAEAVLNNLVEGDTVTPEITYTGPDYSGKAYNSKTVPTNAGKYTATVTLSGTDSQNYNLTGTNTADFIVSQISSNEINLNFNSDILFENDETTKEVKVLLKDSNYTLVEGTDYDIVNNSNKSSEVGKHKLEIKLKGNYSGTLLRDWQINEKVKSSEQVELDEEEFKGKLFVTVTESESVPTLTINTPLNVLTEEEETALKDGTMDIDVVMTLKAKELDDIGEDSKTEISKLVKDLSKLVYVDISIDKILKTLDSNGAVVNTETKPVTETADNVEISIDYTTTSIPKVKAGYSRKYTVIRSHELSDGGYEAKALDTRYKDNMIIFTTNKFSDYAISYVDTFIPIYKAPDTSVR